VREPFRLAGETIAPGERRIVDIPLSRMSDHTPVSLSVQVIHGRRDGPTMFVSAAVHGDEIIGVEIVRRLSRLSRVRRVAGTVLLIPIVNTFGFIGHSRYLPDRRDLNRSFPGSAKGSLAARLAHLFLNEIVARSDCGIDLHSAAIHRTNLPQIRVDLRDAKARRMAETFGAPVIVNSSLRDGSLRSAAFERDVPVMVFEAGEALRFDEFAIRIGVNGTLSVMTHLGMLAPGKAVKPSVTSPISRKSTWIRASEGGVLRTKRKVGDMVAKGDLLGLVADPFGERETEIVATHAGLVIGRTNRPVVNQGDALFHVAALPRSADPGAKLEGLDGEFEGDPLFDEDEIL
jgi:predicted deacylase